MKLLREQEATEYYLQSLTDDLRKMEAGGLRLQALAHQAGLVILAASAGLSRTDKRSAKLREITTEFSAELSALRAAEMTIVPRVDAGIRGQLAEALSPQTLQTFDQLLAQVEIVRTEIAKKSPKIQLSQAELFRFISDELEPVVMEVVEAARLGLGEVKVKDGNLAFVDDLTGLPNRRALYKMAERVWHGSGPDRPLTLMRLDLDFFKAVNDNLGHAAGDYTLRRVAGIMQDHLRADDFVARVGGDEFVLVFFGELTTDTVSQRADALIEAVSQPVEYQENTINVGMSIGVVGLQPGENISLDRLLHNADLALYAAKAAGRSQFYFFTPELRTRHETNETLVAQISKGIEHGEFVPYYQPQVDGRTGKLVGLEALARWVHPERGLLTPYHFLDIARRKGLLEPLDSQITRAAVFALKEWRDMGLNIPQVSINISAERLTKPTIGDELASLVTEAGLPLSAIGLEILESAMIESGSFQMIETVRQLSKSGFSVELDDFGTGHASIANLRHFKVDRIKIDRSFIKDIHLHSELSKITSAMIGLAHSLRIDALGEGVETPEERLILNALGIDHIQGYGVSRPMPHSDVEHWIRRTQSQRSLPKRPKPIE